MLFLVLFVGLIRDAIQKSEYADRKSEPQTDQGILSVAHVWVVGDGCEDFFALLPLLWLLELDFLVGLIGVGRLPFLGPHEVSIGWHVVLLLVQLLEAKL